MGAHRAAVTVQLATPGVIAPWAVAIGPLAPDIQGTWVITLDGSFKGASYLYDVEVYVPSMGQVEHNMVTDPYAVGLTMNSAEALLVDLNDSALKPAKWASMVKPPLAAPEDIVLYELHMRDFSVNEISVPAADRGKYTAFTHLDSNGMTHLKALAQAGLTHVHLLPVFDIATVDEDPAQRVEPNIPAAAPDPDNSRRRSWQQPSRTLSTGATIPITTMRPRVPTPLTPTARRASWSSERWCRRSTRRACG